MAVDVDAVIARVLIARPDADLAYMRKILPNLVGIEDHALTQKIEYLRRHRARKAPASSQRNRDDK